MVIKAKRKSSKRKSKRPLPPRENIIENASRRKRAGEFFVVSVPPDSRYQALTALGALQEDGVLESYGSFSFQHGSTQASAMVCSKANERELRVLINATLPTEVFVREATRQEREESL